VFSYWKYLKTMKVYFIISARHVFSRAFVNLDSNIDTDGYSSILSIKLIDKVLYR